MACGTSVTPVCGAEAHDPDRAVALGRSASNGVAVGKAAGQCQPHACPTGAGDQLKTRAAASGAASHVAQAARRWPIDGGRAAAVGDCEAGERKTLAVVRDSNAAASVAERFDAHGAASRVRVLDSIGQSLIQDPDHLDDVPWPKLGMNRQAL